MPIFKLVMEHGVMSLGCTRKQSSSVCQTRNGAKWSLQLPHILRALLFDVVRRLARLLTCGRLPMVLLFLWLACTLCTSLSFCAGPR